MNSNVIPSRGVKSITEVAYSLKEDLTTGKLKKVNCFLVCE